MTINVIHCTQAINGKPVWFFVDHITMITQNDQGKAVITSDNGSTTAITDTPKAVFDTLRHMLGYQHEDTKQS